MKFKIGSCYQIVFVDHALGTSVINCKTVGWIISEDDTSVTLAYWLLITSDIDLQKNNWETVSIVKSAIISKKKVS